MNWRNRIVGFDPAYPVDQLQANSYNWKIHPSDQQRAITSVLDAVGWVDTVLVNITTSNMIDGHMRVMLAMRRSEPTVPVLFCELTVNEERQVLATLDPIGTMAATDREMLDELLQEVNTTDAGVQQFLADLAEKEKLYKVEGKSKERKEPGDITDKDLEHEAPPATKKYGILVTVESTADQADVLYRLQVQGFNAKAVSV